MFQPISSTLIFGVRDAVLVDPPMTIEQTDRVAQWIPARTVRPWRLMLRARISRFYDLPSLTPTDLGGLSSEIVAELVRGARVVKAFNTLLAAVLASNPVQGGGRRVIFTSSDDVDASAAVAALCERLGFYPIDLGRISGGGRLQHFGGPLSGQNLVKMD